ncbi:hypothetical protein GJ698_14545 [Pseudoduganella sp. FT26W]|uniref:Glycosyltransferase RgtA/B/C/D-like domain-containing protein n=1 Tax=Duganella aquatilis TaxID=2666082 RepID=A0A844D2Y0_9BURK|nr:hypothetical protein [Duganella aquatilis]MRW85301.1 hypothetical protein [Duganella aquatilis]
MKRLLERHGLPLLAALCIGLTLLAAVLWYLQLKADVALLFHSDSDYLPALYHDLVEQGGRLSQWNLTPAPSFLPDWPLFFLARWAAGDFFHALPAYFVLQGLLLFALMLWLARALIDARQALATASCATVLVFYWAMHAISPYIYFYLSAFHCGVFLLLLLSLRLEFRQSCWLLGGVAMLAALSDRLYLLQYTLPAVLTLAALHWRQRLPWKRQALAIVLGSLIGVRLYRLVAHALTLPWMMSLDAVALNLPQLGRILDETWHYAPACLALLMMYYLVLSALLAGALLGRGWRLRQPLAARLALFNWLSMAGTLAAVLLSANTPTVRYFIPAYVLPLLVAPVLLYTSLPQHWHRHLTAALLLCAVWLTQSMLLPVLRDLGATQRTYYPPQVACMDGAIAQYGLQYGMSNYWDAKRFGMLSRHPRMIAPYTKELEPMHWITSESVFRRSYDFVLVGHGQELDVLDAGTLIRQNGAPAARIDCGTFDLLAYPGGGLKNGFR